MDTLMPVIWLSFAAVAYGLMIVGVAGVPMRVSRRPGRIRWWVWVALLTVGLAAVATGFGWFLVVLMLMVWLTVALIRKATPTASAAPPAAREMLAQPSRSVDATLAHAPTSLLCELWTQTSRELRRTYLPSTMCSYAQLRQAILDELTRRNPDGVRRWLEDQPDQRDLRLYVLDHQA